MVSCFLCLLLLAVYVYVIDGSLIEQHAPVPSLSQLSVPWLYRQLAQHQLFKSMCVCAHAHVCLSAFMVEITNLAGVIPLLSMASFCENR